MKYLIKKCLDIFNKETEKKQGYKNIISKSCEIFVSGMEEIKNVKTYEVVYYVNGKKSWTHSKK